MNNKQVPDGGKGNLVVVAANWKSDLPKGTKVRVLAVRGDSALVTVQLTGKPLWGSTFAVPVDILEGQ